MPINGYTVGRDVQIDINTAYGVVTLGAVTSFDSNPDVPEQKITKLNGITDVLYWPGAWNGSLEVERTDSTLDDYWARWEADYYAGVSRPSGTITETITEQDGSVSVYRYTAVQFKLAGAGKKQGDKTVSQNLTFTSQRRLKVA